MDFRDLRAFSWLAAACLSSALVVAPCPAGADEVVPAPAAKAAEEPEVLEPPEHKVEKPATPSAPAAAPAVKPGGSLDFDLFGDSAPAGSPGKPAAPGARLPSGKQVAGDPLVIARQVKRRRLILQLHQGFGFATLAVFAATIVIGQLNYIDKFGGGDFTGVYQNPHLGLAMATTGLFATDALLALCAPNPYPKPIKVDSALLHKVMMGLATAGMVAEIGLGFASASKSGQLEQRNLVLGHLVNGYVTFAAMATGYLAYVF